MTEAHPPDKPPEEPPSDAPSGGDYMAMGIGCLVTLILFGAAIYMGFSRI